MIESLNALKIVLNNVHIHGSFLYILDSPIFFDTGNGIINFKDMTFTFVLLPYIDSVSEELKVNMTSFDVDKIFQGIPDNDDTK